LLTELDNRFENVTGILSIATRRCARQQLRQPKSRQDLHGRYLENMKQETEEERLDKSAFSSALLRNPF